MIDLASDTLTKPTAAMREAMASAEVGDDVFEEDPTVKRLEEHVAELLGKEAALFVPSGSMGNVIGIRTHCGMGDEFLAEADSHIIRYEQASYAQLFGIAAHTVAGGPGGLFELEQIQDKIRPKNLHCAQTKLVCLENTHNYGGGRIQPYALVEEICSWAAENDLARHLDGARLFNAVVATGIPAPQWAQHFDTVSVCFSKGLGAPVGSALCGTHAAIDRARWHRKLLGGGMRQVGILAAGALHALQHHIDRLVEDHEKAQVLANAIRKSKGLSLQSEQVDTNIVFFDVDPSRGTAEEFCANLRQQGVRMLPLKQNSVRAVTHLDVSLDDIEHVAEILSAS